MITCTNQTNFTLQAGWWWLLNPLQKQLTFGDAFSRTEAVNLLPCDLQWKDLVQIPLPFIYDEMSTSKQTVQISTSCILTLCKKCIEIVLLLHYGWLLKNKIESKMAVDDNGGPFIRHSDANSTLN